MSQSSAPSESQTKRRLSALAWSTKCVPVKVLTAPQPRGLGWASWGPVQCLHCADDPDQNQPQSTLTDRA